MTPAKWLFVALVLFAALWASADLGLGLLWGEPATFTRLVRDWSTPGRAAVVSFLAGFAACGLIWHLFG